MEVTPIGTFRCTETYPYDAARQGALALENTGTVELAPGQNFEQAVGDLDGFSHIWLLFQFHRNSHWKPVVQPPRGARKVGLFASRAPYRPNGIGLSCVRLVAVRGRRIDVAGHDLLDGTPILDIKPYIPYADCFPEATGGWTDGLGEARWTVDFATHARAQRDWLRAQGVESLDAFLTQQLAEEPFNGKRKRLRDLDGGQWEIAYRTWRARFTADADSSHVVIEAITSGYTEEELNDGTDPYGDKDIHRRFVEIFP